MLTSPGFFFKGANLSKYFQFISEKSRFGHGRLLNIVNTSETQEKHE